MPRRVPVSRPCVGGIPRRLRARVGFVLCLMSMLHLSIARAAESVPLGHLRLASGDYMTGVLKGCTKPGHISWQCTEFDRPLSFDIIHLKRLETGVPLTPTQEDGSFYFDIGGDDSLTGRLVDADRSAVTLRNPILGEVHIPIAQLSQMRRVESPKDILYSGLASDASIRDAAEKAGWLFKGQSLVAEKSTSRLVGDVRLALQSRIDLRLSWEGQPQFIVALGVNEQESSIASAPRIEVWDRGLVLVQQVKGQADATFLRELADNESDIALTIYQDQAKGQLAVFSTSGVLLGKIQLRENKSDRRASIAFINQGSNWSIDALAVSNWNGSLPYPYGESAKDTERSRRDVTGKLTRMDAAQGLVTFQLADATEVSFALDELATFVPLNASQQKSSQTGDAGLPRVQVTLSDGSQISGELAPTAPGMLSLRTKYAMSAYSCPADQVMSIRKLSDAITALPSATKRMKLKMDGIELTGQLVNMPQVDSNAMLRFQPSIADEWVGIRDLASGSISPGRTNPTAMTVKSDLGVQGNIRVFFPAMANQSDEDDSPVVSAYRTPRGLQLRSGELIDATVDVIDETGVTFHSTATSTTFLPHAVVQSAQLKIPQRGIPIDVKKMERLLTVPRMRRDNPPTHLLITTHGDYVRGRLKRLSQETIEFEEGLSPLTIPRNAVAVIVWLHDRLWDTDDNPLPAVDKLESGFQVHIRLRSLGRFTFQPERVEQDKIFGTSPLLGSIHCAVADIENLEFGKNLVERLSDREENAWRLSLAKSPLVFEDSDANGLPSIEQLGTSSDLVGKPAPNFELKSIIGQPWRLGNQLGKVIVLDFWASWCGPCMEAMPQVERIVTDLAREDIQWVGINIQESAERAQTSIDRLNIQSLVLLDEEGGVGNEYDAQAIPLTVIIDREGIVRHVFVGGGDDILAGIAKAIHAFDVK